MERDCCTGCNSQPIGVFDSGVGGLSVWMEILRQLPGESTLYFADQAHIPYGNRSLQEIRRYATGITSFLLNQGAKLIVVACNTASGAALQNLRTVFPEIPFVGMEPAVKPAVENTHTGHVGVIATPTTYEGILYKQLVRRFERQVTIHTQICPGLVEKIEAGQIDSPTTHALLQECLQPLAQHNIDQLVLGCTHYPFISELALRILGSKVSLINPAPAVARQTKRLLDQKLLQCSKDHIAEHIFFTSGSVQEFTDIAYVLVKYSGKVSQTIWVDGKLIYPQPTGIAAN
jgi:glutamate racemase